LPFSGPTHAAGGLLGFFGGGLIEVAFGALAEIIAGLSEIIFFVLGMLLRLASGLYDVVLRDQALQKFTQASIVQTGWAISRDTANMFFSLILLVISFATILRIEEYGVKRIIPKLIIAALLINFSLVIAGVVIDFTQVLTKYFFDAAKGKTTISTQIMNAIDSGKLLSPPPAAKDTANTLSPASSGTTKQQTDLWNDPYGISDPKFQETTDIKKTTSATNKFLMIITNLFFGSIILIVAILVVFAGAIMLIIRVIVLWFLLILAPLAWLMYILPATQTYWHTWWDKFFKQAFFAPAYGFMLYIALTVLAKGPILKSSGNTSFDAVFVINYIIIIGLLMGALMAAQQMGAYGASTFMDAAKGLKRTGIGALKGIGSTVDRWAARGAEAEGKGVGARLRRATSYLSPEAWKIAWKARQEQRKREALPVAAGARQDLLNKVLTWGIFKGKLGEKTDYRERAVRFRRGQERKDIVTTNSEEMINSFETAKKAGNFNRMAGYLQALTEQNDQNELFRYYNKNFGTNYTMTAQGMMDFTKEQLVPVMGEQTAYRMGHDLIRTMEGNGQWIGRPFYVDPATGQYKMTDKSEDAERAANKEWAKQDPQKQALGTGRFSYIIEGYNEKGETVDMGLSEGGKGKIALLQPNQANRIHAHSKATLMFRHAADFKRLNAGSYENVLTDIKNAAGGKDAPEEQILNYVKNATANIPRLSTDQLKQAVEMIKGASSSDIDWGKVKEEWESETK